MTGQSKRMADSKEWKLLAAGVLLSMLGTSVLSVYQFLLRDDAEQMSQLKELQKQLQQDRNAQHANTVQQARVIVRLELVIQELNKHIENEADMWRIVNENRRLVSVADERSRHNMERLRAMQ